MNKSFYGLVRLIRESLNKLIPFMPFDFAQESVRQAHHERNQRVIVVLSPSASAQESLVEGLNQSFLRLAVIERLPKRRMMDY
jgi:hypothetical protein